MTKEADKLIGTEAYEQGRAAVRGAISVEDAPYGKDDDNLEAWKAGYAYERKALGLDPAKPEPFGGKGDHDDDGKAGGSKPKNKRGA